MTHLRISENTLHLLILLLASGGIGLCSDVIREYYLINTAMNWTDAQSYCRKKYTDLATVGNSENMTTLVSTATASGASREIWIGLRETGPASWLWSVGETENSAGVAEYTNWAKTGSASISSTCGAMRSDGKWLSSSCTTARPFVCQSEKGPSELQVVSKPETWRAALQYCRENNKELASARSEAENLAIQKIFDDHDDDNEKIESVWIGLFQDEWKWSDQSASSFRYWHSTQPNNDGKCVLYNPSDRTWYDRGCAQKFLFCCYKEKMIVTRRIVGVELMSDSFLDFNNAAVTQDILNQIQTKNQQVKLKWRVQPDGNIFHIKEKKKIIEGY